MSLMSWHNIVCILMCFTITQDLSEECTTNVSPSTSSNPEPSVSQVVFHIEYTNQNIIGLDGFAVEQV